MRKVYEMKDENAEKQVESQHFARFASEHDAHYGLLDTEGDRNVPSSCGGQPVSS